MTHTLRGHRAPRVHVAKAGPARHRRRVPATHVADPQQLEIELRLNGATMQHEGTADMIFGVARLIEYLSGLVQLLPGDLVCTGSPSGNGTHHGRYLRPGDGVERRITGLGVQRSPVVCETR